MVKPARGTSKAAVPALPRPGARVGLFGGSFDPVHKGHLAVARMAMEKLSLDRLYFLPAARAPLRSLAPGASSADRLRFLQFAIKEEKNPRLGVLDIELRAGGVNYTVDTLRKLRKAWPKARLFWVLGSDQFAQLDRWRRPEEIARMVEFAVLDRPGAPAGPPPSLAAQLHWHNLGVPGAATSSTEVRRRRQAGKAWEFLLPRSVADAIEKGNFYRA